MTEILCLDADAGRTHRLRRQRIDREGMIGIHRLVAQRQEGACRHFQQIVGTVAQHDLIVRHAVTPHQTILQCKSIAIRIETDVVERITRGGERRRARAQRILVRGKLDDIA